VPLAVDKVTLALVGHPEPATVERSTEVTSQLTLAPVRCIRNLNWGLAVFSTVRYPGTPGLFCLYRRVYRYAWYPTVFGSRSAAAYDAKAVFRW